ncbi:hypothetical protein BDZ94DRAFT_1316305 [Collybia nuda]|uniref:Uncharacterized protein n=1 Tax=Collybia nuda TaxID=64659 RepID=A0A9P5XRR7_9AGAR|nr:hypothetical protein BDZ94DRAFT_1316305 [Collybia nuda]
METLPPSFYGPIRDPNLKRQSNYKAYEWMALLHWYILPIGIELEFNTTLLENFSDFVAIVETAMTIQSHSMSDLACLKQLVIKFLQGYEKYYVGNDPEKILRCRLCIFQLIHITTHIRWYGSVRLGSQATVERAIGELGHKIHSKKEPFANLTNIMIEHELIKVLQLYYPELIPESTGKNIIPDSGRLMQPLKLQNQDWNDPIGHLSVIKQYFVATNCFANTREIDVQSWNIHCFGKLKMKNQQTLQSSYSNSQISIKTTRYSRWFEAIKPNAQLGEVFGEAIAFYSIEYENHIKLMMVYNPLGQLYAPLQTVICGRWSSPNQLAATETVHIQNLIGVWKAESQNIYVLRKHPGLLDLSPAESGAASLDLDENN